MSHHKISKATHFTGPVLFSNQVPSLENLNTGAYPDQRIFFDDFGQQVYNGNVIGTAVTAGAQMGQDYTSITGSNAGTVAIAANALQGALALSTANTAATDAITTQGDLTFNVPQNSNDENVTPYRTYFETRFKLNNFTGAPAIFVGLAQIIDASGNAATDAVAGSGEGRIGFNLTAGDTVLRAVCRADNNSTYANIDAINDGNYPKYAALGTVTADTYLTVGFEVFNNNNLGRNRVNFYINRELYGTITNEQQIYPPFVHGSPISGSTASSIPATAATRLGVAFDMINSVQNASIMTVDYVLAAQDREIVYNYKG
jgi:hypothetical protein